MWSVACVFSSYQHHLDGKVPRAKDVATVARWDHEDAGERDAVPVGHFWYTLTHSTDKERLQRLRNFDDDSKNALESLAKCEPRKANLNMPSKKRVATNVSTSSSREKGKRDKDDGDGERRKSEIANKKVKSG